MRVCIFFSINFNFAIVTYSRTAAAAGERYYSSFFSRFRHTRLGIAVVVSRCSSLYFIISKSTKSQEVERFELFLLVFLHKSNGKSLGILCLFG